MNPADRIALTERMARGLVWIETGQRQTERIGWMLVETEPGGEEAETDR